MSDISKITLPSGTTYDIKDQGARDLIAALGSYAQFLGVTTSDISDGSTTNPIVVGGKSITAKAGDIASKGSKEFIFNGTTWQEFGDLSGLGSLAYKNSASGNVSVPKTFSTTVTATTNKTASTTIKPEGSIGTGTGTANYTPAGTVSQPTFSGSSLTSTGKFTPSGSVTISKASTGTANYTPAGTVSTPTITVTPTTGTIKEASSKTVASALATAAPGATAPANAKTVCDVDGETLRFYQVGYTTTASISTSDKSVVTGITSATSTQPTFTGTGAVLTGSFTGTEGNVSVSGTPSGTVSQPTFTGTGAHLTFTGTEKSYTSGNIAVPNTFSTTVASSESKSVTVS